MIYDSYIRKELLVPYYKQNGGKVGNPEDRNIYPIKFFAKILDKKVLVVRADPSILIYKTDRACVIKYLKTDFNDLNNWKNFKSIAKDDEEIQDILFKENNLQYLKFYLKKFNHAGGEVIALFDISQKWITFNTSVTLIFRDKRTNKTFVHPCHIHEVYFEDNQELNRTNIWNLPSEQFKKKIIWKIFNLIGSVNWEDYKQNIKHENI